MKIRKTSHAKFAEFREEESREQSKISSCFLFQGKKQTFVSKNDRLNWPRFEQLTVANTLASVFLPSTPEQSASGEAFKPLSNCVKQVSRHLSMPAKPNTRFSVRAVAASVISKGERADEGNWKVEARARARERERERERERWTRSTRCVEARSRVPR